MSDNANDGVRLFAKAAIAAALTINSGALIAVLSQMESLIAFIASEYLATAMKSWTVGVILAALAWVFATLAASAHANHHRKSEVTVGILGYLAVAGSIGSFAVGAWITANAIGMN